MGYELPSATIRRTLGTDQSFESNFHLDSKQKHGLRAIRRRRASWHLEQIENEQ